MASPVRPAAAIAWRSVGAAFAIDVVLVVVFAMIGRTSHAEQLNVAGVWQTAWPFLAGLVLGWLVTRPWRAPFAPVRTGIGLWAMTVVGGMLLRGVSGQGTAVAFVVVASIVLLVFLVGWRAIAALVARSRRTPATAEATR